MPTSIGFIFPSSDYLHDPFRGDPHTHFQILTVLESRFKDQVSLYLPDLRGIKREFAIYHIPECDVYLHSVYTLDFDEQCQIVTQLRERFPKSKHIAGGPHVAMFHDDSLQVFDALILGDGEELISSAVLDFMSGNLKKVYKQEEGVDINQYPFPLRKYLPKTSVARKGLLTTKRRPDYHQLLSTTVIFSRGCPYKCHFCSLPQTKEYGLGIRFRDTTSITQEINYLKSEYDIQGISLLDEICIPLSRPRAIAHLEAIGETHVLWRGQCRVDGLTPELIKLARESGCVTMCMGVESVSQKSLDMINKKIDVEEAKATIRMLKESGIETRIYMIQGLPGEPENIVEQTWNFIQETSPDLVYLSLFTVRPGTEVYHHPEKFGIRQTDVLWGKTMHMYGRYGDEEPNINFEYEKGMGFSKERIAANYLELQRRLREHGLATIARRDSNARPSA